MVQMQMQEHVCHQPETCGSTTCVARANGTQKPSRTETNAIPGYRLLVSQQVGAHSLTHSMHFATPAANEALYGVLT